jgi:uncharacterized protein (TIGR03435 family)
MVRALVGLAVALCALPFGIAAQSPPSSERFVAASIKPADQRLGGRAGPDRYYGVSTLDRLLFETFDLPSFLMFGLPGWAFDERWEVSAKADGPRSREQMRPLLRALLEDRFSLRVHHERRDLPVYELVHARADRQTGPALKAATGECDPFANGQRPFSESRIGRNRLSICLGPLFGANDRVVVQVHNYRIQQFANLLRSSVGRAVVDRTGLTGLFDIEFEFRPGPFLPGDTLDSDVPSLETALRESLGLKLQSARGMVDVLVIDSVERPSPN